MNSNEAKLYKFITNCRTAQSLQIEVDQMELKLDDLDQKTETAEQSGCKALEEFLATEYNRLFKDKLLKEKRLKELEAEIISFQLEVLTAE